MANQNSKISIGIIIIIEILLCKHSVCFCVQTNDGHNEKAQIHKSSSSSVQSSIVTGQKVFHIKEDFQNCVDLAVKTIKAGGIIALPTDTVYGLASNVEKNEAIQKLYDAKGRMLSKPLAICVKDIKSIGQYGNISHLPKDLLDNLFPGPVTIIVHRSDQLNPNFNPKFDKVAIRIPQSDFIKSLIDQLKFPLALTSANKSNETSSVKVEQFSSIWPSIDAIFDYGDLGSERKGSTIVDLSIPGCFKVIREGGYFNQTLNILVNYKMKAV